jgi:hypothetical protein
MGRAVMDFLFKQRSGIAMLNAPSSSDAKRRKKP